MHPRLSLLLALFLGGCAIGPRYQEPATAAPPVWHASLPHSGSVVELGQWWQQFDDPILSQLIDAAEQDSPTLTRAWASIEKARATLRTTRASALPALSGTVAATRATEQSAGTSTLTSVETTSSADTSRSAGLDASWELDLFGKARRNAEAARARIEARIDDWHDARVSLAAEVADTYVQFRACGLLADTYERELTSITETERATHISVGAGLGSPADGALARASLASTTSTLISQRAQCELLIKSIVNLTGMDETALRALLDRGGKSVPQPAALEVQSVPAEVLRQRPDLASLERELAAVSAEIGAARADLYPSLSLSGLITASATSAGSLPTTWSFGPTLSIPLFDASRRRAAVDSARASYTAALASYQQGVRNVVTEVEQALVNLDAAARRTDEADRATREYRRYYDATETYWRAGGASLLTLEEARRSALSAEIQLITLQRDRVEYWIALYEGLGGGWRPGDPATSPEALAREQADRS